MSCMGEERFAVSKALSSQDVLFQTADRLPAQPWRSGATLLIFPLGGRHQASRAHPHSPPHHWRLDQSRDNPSSLCPWGTSHLQSTQPSPNAHTETEAREMEIQAKSADCFVPEPCLIQTYPACKDSSSATCCYNPN